MALDILTNEPEAKRIRSYSSPLNLGHKHLYNLFEGPVVIQEKVDGSQFSFGVRDGELFCRSRRQMIELSAPGMFAAGVATVSQLFHDDVLVPGHTYRGEYLSKPKHNTLKYLRVPKGNIILFDIDQGYEDYMVPGYVIVAAEFLGLEYVPTWEADTQPEISELKAWAGEESILGGIREGIVIKNYAQLGSDHKTLMGKYVNETFKESHTSDWRKRNPTRGDMIAGLVEAYKTDARWEKAIQHFAEEGCLQNAPQDIGPLIREIQADVKFECEDEIKELLFKHFWKDISRQLTAGFPEWYKNRLMENMLDADDNS
jgi:hypothetical protein